MTDQLYCPECADKWNGAYNSDHRCVTCGSPLKAEKVMEKLKAAEEERDALAAHVERWHDVYVDLTNNMVMFDGVSHYVADNAMMRRFDEIDESAPTTSLARLKSQWQAEALAEEARGFDQDARDSDSFTEKCAYRRVSTRLLEMADELRRQAEGEP